MQPNQHFRIATVGRVLGALVALLVISVASVCTAEPLAKPQNSPGTSAKLAEGSQSLHKLWQHSGMKLPVIVEFAMPAVPDPGVFADADDADAARKNAIRSVQEAILADFFGIPASLVSAEPSPEMNLKLMAFTPLFGMIASAEDVERLAADPRVLRIHEDGLSRPQLDNTLVKIGMPEAYSAGATGNGFHVAVLDTGARRSHEFLSRQVVAAACFSTTGQNIYYSLCPGGVAEYVGINGANDCDALTIEGCGHGTHVTGIVGGFNTNLQSGEPVSGVARDSRLISINVFSRSTFCPDLDEQYTGCLVSYDSDQIRGLEHVYSLRNTYPTAAVNLSVGIDYNDSSACDWHPLKPAIDLLRAAGIVTVTAAGADDGSFVRSVYRPACISTVVTVASWGPNDFQPSLASKWGDLVDLVAGARVTSSNIGRCQSAFVNVCPYGEMSGTSMAAAQVAGAFAALRSAVPGASVHRIEDALKSTGADVTRFDITRSRIRVAHALTALQNNTAPANNNFANRTNIPVPGTVTGTNYFATAEAGEPNHAGDATARNSVWWRYTPSATGPIIVDTRGSGFDTILAVYTGGSVGSLSAVASNNDFHGTRSQVSFHAVAGTSYAIAVAGKANASGAISLRVAAGLANDNFASRITIPGPGTVTGTNAGASAEPGEPVHAGRSSARTSVWWRYTPSSAGTVTIRTAGSSFDTVLAVYTGNTVSSLAAVASNDDFNGSQSQVVFQGAAGTSYAIAVAGYENATGSISLTVVSGNPASIVAAVTPVARATRVGSTVTAFATIINSGNETATNCFIQEPENRPLDFTYRSRNHVTGALGPVDQPVNIAAGARQDFLMAFTATAAMQSEMQMRFECANAPRAPSVFGLNTFLLTATASSPPADLISIAVTATNDGIMNIPLGGTGFAVLAAQNIGAPATLQARLSSSSILNVQTSLPGTMLLCRTNPTTGACQGNPTPTVNFTPSQGQMVTFTAFVASNGTPIPFDPALTRLFVHFFQGSIPVGSASVAARTVAGGGGTGEQAVLID